MVLKPTRNPAATPAPARAAGKGNLPDTLAGELRKEIQASDVATLPPIRDMADHFGVSLLTMFKAIQILKRQGIVSTHKNRPIAIVGRQEKGAEPVRRQRQSQVLGAELRERIEDGTLRAGRALPKVSFLAAEKRVSTHTVLKAYGLLKALGLAYQEGRTWKVGQARKLPAFRVPAKEPVVMVLQGGKTIWRLLCLQERTRGFTDNFRHEAADFRVRIQVAQTEALEARHSYPTGMEQVGQAIRALGDRYLGTLIPVQRADLPNLDSWTEFLAGFRKPVVWFDRNDDGWARKGRNRQVFRCHYLEEDAIRKGLDILAKLGHRRLAVFGYYHNGPAIPDWVLRRAEKVLRIARQSFPGMQVTPCLGHVDEVLDPVEAGDGWRWEARKRALSPLERKLGKLFTQVAEPGEPDQYFYNVARILGPALVEGSTTAVLCLQDMLARPLFEFLVSVGVAVPNEMSILSFDNSAHMDVAVSTLDFGFQSLGYCAFHLILNDMHIRRDRSGNVPTQALLVDHGSLWSARSGPIQLRLRRLTPWTLG